MSITGVILSSTGSSGSFGRGAVRRYTSTYLVQTDDANDQAGTVIQHFETDILLPFIGSIYAYSGEFDTLAFCTTIRPRKVAKSQFVWQVSLTFESITERGNSSKEIKNDGTPTEDPLEFRDDIQISSARFTGPVRVAENVKEIGSRPANTKGPITNSAGEIFEPAFERDFSRRVLRFTKQVAKYNDAWDEFIDVVNSDEVTIVKPAGFNQKYPPHTLKVASIDPSLERRNETDFWSVMIEIDHNRDGWRFDDIVDKGTNARAEPGDPDGNGGTYTPSDLVSGQPAIRPITSLGGFPITGSVLLDGNGQPKQNQKDPATLLEYIVYEERSFSVLDL